MKRAINLAALFLAVLAACATTTVDIPQNRYGLRVVPDLATYERLAHADPNKRLVDLGTLGIPLDIRYATANNFMKKPLYPIAKGVPARSRRRRPPRRAARPRPARPRHQGPSTPIARIASPRRCGSRSKTRTTSPIPRKAHATTAAPPSTSR
jgi:hypothetical protein